MSAVAPLFLDGQVLRAMNDESPLRYTVRALVKRSNGQRRYTLHDGVGDFTLPYRVAHRLLELAPAEGNAMSEVFPFKIGDKIRLPHYEADRWIEVAWIGIEFFGATNGNVYGDFDHWEPWVAPPVRHQFVITTERRAACRDEVYVHMTAPLTLKRVQFSDVGLVLPIAVSVEPMGDKQ